ncbi:tetratricopeptide repeat protein [Thermus sp. 2.9]|uniref:tetratricopeptide repeat protein n=1 Tax=Thermus sp. (strain 2.9) TaxID=1577051 RepID=UPI00054195FF|nr:tetratricopeptide repeat protein [Thermus sp. 2.9]KHG65375.1 tetratricopeptide repeat protein [Thermus sp. 2.9]
MMRRVPKALPLLLGLGLALAQPSLEEAEALLRAGEYGKAALAYEEILAQDYGRLEAHLGLGVALAKSGRLEEARFAFLQMTQVFPDRYEGYYNLGQVYLRLAKPKEAAEAFSKAVELNPTEEAYLGLASALSQAGQAQEAAQALKRGLTPERTPAYRLALAQALYAAQAWVEAVPVLYGLVNREPGLAEAWDLLARILAEEGLKERALRELDRGLKAVEGKERAKLLLRKALLSPTPEPLLREAYALDPSLWQAAYLLGQRRLEAGDARGALGFLQAAYRVSPEPEVALALAAAYLRLGDAQNAYRYAEEAGPPGTFLKAQAAVALGRKAEALRLLEGLSAPEAQALRGALLLEAGRAEEAVALLRPLYEAGRNPEVGVNLAAGLLALGRLGEAELVLREVLERAPRQAAAWYNLGLALRGLGRQQEAERALRQAASLGSKEAQALLRR